MFREMYRRVPRLIGRFSSLTLQSVAESNSLAYQTISTMKQMALLLDSSHSQAFGRFFERMGLGDFTAIMNKIVEKVCSNLRYWGDTDCVIEVSLRLFLELSRGYQGCRMLLGLESVEFLLQNHTVRFEFAVECRKKRSNSSVRPVFYRCGISTMLR